MVSISHAKLYTAPFNLKEPPTAPRLRPHHLQLGSGTALSLGSLWAALQPGAPDHPGCGNSQKQAKGQTRKGKRGKNELSLNQSQPMVYSRLTLNIPRVPKPVSKNRVEEYSKGIGKLQPRKKLVQEKIYLSLNRMDKLLQDAKESTKTSEWNQHEAMPFWVSRRIAVVSISLFYCCV